MLGPVPAADFKRYEIASALLQLRAERRSLTPRALQLRHPTLWRAIERLFGSHERALSFAGINHRAGSRPTFVRWDKDRIVRCLRELAARQRDLNTGAIQKHEPALGGAIYRHFGSHDAALIAAGVDPTSVRQARSWTHQDVVAELKRRQRDGEDLSSKGLCRNASPLYGAMIRRFGSVGNALRGAGIDPEQVKRPWPVVWPTERIVSGIRAFYAAWWAKHPRTEPTQPRLSGAFPALANAARARFGSIGAALDAVGIDDPTYRPPRKWSRPQVLELLRKLHKRGTELSHTAIALAEPNLPNAASRHFGTLRDAVKAAGLPYARHPRSDRKELRHWTEDLVLRTLREMRANGDDLRYRPIKQRAQSLYWAAHQLFGSYENAVRSAGIDYWAMSQAALARQRRKSRKR